MSDDAGRPTQHPTVDEVLDQAESQAGGRFGLREAVEALDGARAAREATLTRRVEAQRKW